MNVGWAIVFAAAALLAAAPARPPDRRRRGSASSGSTGAVLGAGGPDRRHAAGGPRATCATPAPPTTASCAPACARTPPRPTARCAAEAQHVSALRAQAARSLADAVTQAMQGLGMAGGRFEVALLAQEQPQSFGLENVEFQVAGHAGATPRALAKVASGGELSRLALAIAVTTSRARGVSNRWRVQCRHGHVDLRRDRRRHRRHGRRRGRCIDETARPVGTGAVGDPPGAGGRLRRSPLGGQQAPGGRPRAERPAARHRRSSRRRDRTHARRRTSVGHRACASLAARRGGASAETMPTPSAGSRAAAKRRSRT